MDGRLSVAARRIARGAARGAACALVAVLVACASGPEAFPTVSDLDTRFPRFPEDLDADVRVVPEQGAVLALAHVRQTHLPVDLPRRADQLPDGRAAFAARVRAANESQRGVHAVLRRLAADGWDRVFAEGNAIERPLGDRVAQVVEYMGDLDRIDALVASARPSFVQRFVRYGTADDTGDPEWEAVRYAPGAELLLALTGEIRLLPAERVALTDAAVCALRDGGVEAAAAYSERREDSVLAEVAAHDDGAAVVLLGAAHDLTDNVAHWNRTHRDRRMTLLVVTPR